MGGGIAQEHHLKIYTIAIYLEDRYAYFLHPVYHLDGNQNEATNPLLPGVSGLTVDGYTTL